MPPRYSREIEQPIVMGDSLKDQFRTSPCEASCPAGNPIQKMQSLVEKGRFGEALRYLRARNPFPGVTGAGVPPLLSGEVQPGSSGRLREHAGAGTRRLRSRPQGHRTFHPRAGNGQACRRGGRRSRRDDGGLFPVPPRA